MFVRSPVRRLSIPTTETPRSNRYSDRCDPMKPAAPVTSALGINSERGIHSRASDMGGRRGGRSIRMFLAEATEQGENQDLHVEQQGPVLDVVEVVLDPLLDRRVPAPAVDLRPPGDAALHAVAEHVLRNPLLELLYEGRPLRPRPHQAHVPEDHVDELGQLVEVEPAQPDPDGRAARVLGARPYRARVLLRLVHHGAELEDLERLPIQRHALLAQEHGATTAAPADEQRDAGEDRSHYE